MRVLLAAMLVVAAFCAVTAQTDCKQLFFEGQIFTLMPRWSWRNWMPVYESKHRGVSAVLYIYYNTGFTSDIGVKTHGWACNTEKLDTSYVYDLSYTTANRPWLSPLWYTGLANPKGAAKPVPAPKCIDAPSVPAPQSPVVGPGIPMPLVEVQVELPSEICSALSEEKVSAIVEHVSGVAKAALKCPALVVSCSGPDAAQACPALRERLLSPTSALRRALRSAGAAM